MHTNAMHRLQILELLYKQMESEPSRPWVHHKQLNTWGKADFALASLMQLGMIEKKGSSYRIAGVGILEVEAQENE